MSNLLKCPYRESVSNCSNCNPKGTIYNYEKKCPCSDVEYVPAEIYKPVVEGMPTAVTQVGMQRTSKERKKRSVDHFKREVYPTLSKQDRKLFAKKHNLKT